MNDMKEIAEKATNLSTEAFEITKNAANQQKNIRYNIFSHKLKVFRCVLFLMTLFER